MLKDNLSEQVVRKGDSIFTRTSYSKPLFKEKILKEKGTYIREWNVKRSKLGAAILKGLNILPIKRNSRVLYLGASTGTTVSYISDIAPDGMVYAVELSYDPFIKLLDLSLQRNNVIPILEDAVNPEKYSFLVEHADVIYQDISQRDQVGIFNRNAEIFPEARWGLLVLKARSITARKKDSEILRENISGIRDFKTVQVIDLQPYDISNYLILLKK